MIEAKGLRGGYGRREVIRGVSLSLSLGEVLALLGPNGSGKTTLLRLLVGLLKPREGKVLLDGKPVAALSRKALVRKIGFVLGEINPWPVSLRDYIALSSPKRAPEETLEMAGLPPDALLAELSAGELARARLARVWAQAPDYYILDEPTAHLDPPHAAWALELMREEAKKGKGALLVLHDPNLARRADRVVFLKEGQIAAHGLSLENLKRVYGTEVREGPGFFFSPPPPGPWARSP